jgi:hypothetical protein
MNHDNAYLMAAAIVVPLIVIMVWLYVWIDRHRSPDAARLKILRILLWFASALAAVYSVAEIRTLATGEHSISTVLWALIPWCSFGLLIGTLIWQIRRCKQRLSGHGT